jgi:hypothetical protein
MDVLQTEDERLCEHLDAQIQWEVLCKRGHWALRVVQALGMVRCPWRDLSHVPLHRKTTQGSTDTTDDHRTASCNPNLKRTILR